MSRATRPENLHMLVLSDGTATCKTKNVVYHESIQ